LVFDVSEEEIGAADIFINITKLTLEERKKNKRAK